MTKSYITPLMSFVTVGGIQYELPSAVASALNRRQERDDALVAALRRSLNWLSSYPGGCALGAYDEARAALDAVEKGE